jgi:hypothetical protein
MAATPVAIHPQYSHGAAAISASTTLTNPTPPATRHDSAWPVETGLPMDANRVLANWLRAAADSLDREYEAARDREFQEAWKDLTKRQGYGP